MEIKQMIKKALCQACVIFTLVTVLYGLIVLFLNVDDDTILLEGSRIFLFLLFSLLLALANTLFSAKAIPSWTRYLIHFFLSGFAFYLCMIYPASEGQTPGFTVVGIALFAIIYAIAAALRAFFGSRYKKIKEEEAPYTKRFGK